jgi:hypothetical protein
MKHKLLVIMTLAMFLPGLLQAQELAGDWAGTLDTGIFKLRLVLRLSGSGNALKAELQSPDQSEMFMAADSVKVEGSALDVVWSPIHAEFKATLDKSGQVLDGNWTQGPLAKALTLQRRNAGEVATGPKRPQNPAKPYPYKEEEVSFFSPKAGINLSGTLTLPTGKGPFPAVVLIPGSGPHDRDESLFGHKPFLVLADALTRQGIAVLRYDDRGVGRSQGNFATATTFSLADDAEAALEYLKTRPEVDMGRLGLLGHSEGGEIAPLVASRNPLAGFVVMLGGPGVKGSEIVVEQTRLLTAAAGATADQANSAADSERQMLDAVMQGKSAGDLALLLVKLAGSGVTLEQAKTAVEQLSSPWFRSFIAYDPAPVLRKVNVPVLALFGSKDLQVPAAQNMVPVRKALADGGNTVSEVTEIAGVNHLFQHSQTGSLQEYGQIEETMAPEVMNKISAWILAREGRR